MARIFPFTLFLLAASLHGELPPAAVRLVEGATAQIAEPALPSARPLIIHNIGAGSKAEDRLFDFQIIGHYRYF